MFSIDWRTLRDEILTDLKFNQRRLNQIPTLVRITCLIITYVYLHVNKVMMSQKLMYTAKQVQAQGHLLFSNYMKWKIKFTISFHDY